MPKPKAVTPNPRTLNPKLHPHQQLTLNLLQKPWLDFDCQNFQELGFKLSATSKHGWPKSQTTRFANDSFWLVGPNKGNLNCESAVP